MSRHDLTAFKYAAIVAFGGFIFGLDAALMSGTIGYITTEFGLSDILLGWVVSAPGFGVLGALLFTGIICDKIGRKKTLLIIASLYLISAVTSAFAPSAMALLFARLLGGFAFTSLSLASMYIGEIAPTKMRGKLVSMNQLTIVVGLSAAYFSNYYLQQLGATPPQWMVDLGFQDNVWRWMLGMEIVPAFIWLSLLLLIPESPRWLALNGRNKEAAEVLSKLHSAEAADAELNDIQQSAAESTAGSSISNQVKQLFAHRYRIAVLIGVTIALVQPVTGINAIMFYAPTVFEQVGIGTDAAFFQAVIVGVISVIFTVLALLTIDKFGRRVIVILGLSAAAICLLICAYGFNSATYSLDNEAVVALQTNTENQNLDGLSALVGQSYETDVEFKQALRSNIGEKAAKSIEADAIKGAIDINVTLVLFGLLAFIAAFQYSIGPVMWVVFSEIVPTAIRGVAIPFFAFWTSLASWLIQLFFPWQLTVMGVGQIMLFYASMVIIGLFALIKILPETKNRSIEEIEAQLVRN